ncbi:MAG: TIM barrel protein [Candidatus Micrarchaeota archaeon]|nr:TIM barrel protein [Candidatus Micrarchaeota archaeon]MCX8154767.1 TIM barrel protein [Candidatus Micrarchaeota archaeon]
MIKFGTAGIPVGCKRCSSIDAIEYIKRVGLDSLELEFVRGVKMNETTAESIREMSNRLDVIISSHAPYYINLLSRDKNILERSKQHITKSLRITDIAGGYLTCIHTGYYVPLLGQEENYRIVRDLYRELNEWREQNRIKTKIAPESRGKKRGFGSVDELIRLYHDVDIMPVFDIAHIHATGEFDFRSEDEYHRFFRLVDGLIYHVHFSEINYTDAGEKNHLNVGDRGEPDYRSFLKVAKEIGIKMNVISETPDLERSAIVMKTYYLKTI